MLKARYSVVYKMFIPKTKNILRAFIYSLFGYKLGGGYGYRRPAPVKWITNIPALGVRATVGDLAGVPRSRLQTRLPTGSVTSRIGTGRLKKTR